MLKAGIFSPPGAPAWLIPLRLALLCRVGSLQCPTLSRNIFNVISGGFGTEQKPSGASASSQPAGEHREATPDIVAQKMLAAKVSKRVLSRASGLACWDYVQQV